MATLLRSSLDMFQKEVNPLEKTSFSNYSFRINGMLFLIRSCVNSLIPVFKNIDIFCWSDPADYIYLVSKKIEYGRNLFKIEL